MSQKRPTLSSLIRNSIKKTTFIYLLIVDERQTAIRQTVSRKASVEAETSAIIK